MKVSVLLEYLIKQIKKILKVPFDLSQKARVGVVRCYFSTSSHQAERQSPVFVIKVEVSFHLKFSLTSATLQAQLCLTF